MADAEPDSVGARDGRSGGAHRGNPWRDESGDPEPAVAKNPPDDRTRWRKHRAAPVPDRPVKPLRRGGAAAGGLWNLRSVGLRGHPAPARNWNPHGTRRAEAKRAF